MAAGFGRHGMPPPASNDTGRAPLGQDGSDWSRDLATLTFDLEGHGACGWCGSSSSICIPRLKLVVLAVRNIWCTMCVSINGPGDLDLWPFDLETSMRVASKVGNLPSKFGRAIGVCVLQLLFAMYATDGQTDIWTDGRTDGRNQRLLPPIRGCIDLRMKFCNLEYLLAIVSFIWVRSNFVRWRIVVQAYIISNVRAFSGGLHSICTKRRISRALNHLTTIMRLCNEIIALRFWQTDGVCS